MYDGARMIRARISEDFAAEIGIGYGGGVEAWERIKLWFLKSQLTLV